MRGTSVVNSQSPREYPMLSEKVGKIVGYCWSCQYVRVGLMFSLILAVGLISSTSPENQGQEGRKAVGTRASDSLALVDFYTKTKGTQWIESWDFSQSMDTWFGVSLNPYGRVMCLDLDGEPDCSPTKRRGNRIKGQMIDLNLPYLEHLFLSGNQLQGQIPNFSKMPFLLTLQLSCNRFTDTIPDFTNFTRLVSLELDYNKLTGEIPAFTHLSSMQNLYVSNNKLSGALPLFKHSHLLRRLYVQGNQLTGSLPLLNGMPNLQRFIGFDNQFEGRIPDLHMLGQITHLNLGANKLSSEIPPLDGLVQLRSLVLADNDLEGSIPDLTAMSHLIELNLSDNRLTGAIPDLSGKHQLRSLLLAGNQLSECPVLRNLPQLNQCAFQENAFDFSDLVPNQKWLQGLDSYEKQLNERQDSVIQLTQGKEVRISAGLDRELESNTYTWFKDGTEFKVMEGENTLTARLSLVEDQATYYCEITNDALPGLVFKSGVFILQSDKLEGPIALAPLPYDDHWTFSKLKEEYEINLIANDQMNGTAEWDLKLISRPENGQIELLEDGKLQFIPNEDFVGMVEFEYELCNKAAENLCNIAFVSIDIQAEVLPSDTTVQVNFDDLRIFPNPAVNVVNLSTEKGLQLEQVTVFNLAGQLVLEQPVLDGQIRVGIITCR
ncbi:MAG: hypothetical protein HRU41_25495 [Saprospiraceae bacterium]|nr:hypothetical protein [Saprospiraceae bacterium]